MTALGKTTLIIYRCLCLLNNSKLTNCNKQICVNTQACICMGSQLLTFQTVFSLPLCAKWTHGQLLNL